MTLSDELALIMWVCASVCMFTCERDRGLINVSLCRSSTSGYGAGRLAAVYNRKRKTTETSCSFLEAF